MKITWKNISQDMGLPRSEQSPSYRFGEYTVSREWRRTGGQHWFLRGPAISPDGLRCDTKARATAYLVRHLEKIATTEV